jgi:hypothetical protein
MDLGGNVSHVEFERSLSCGIMILSRNPQISLGWIHIRQVSY